MVRLMNRVATFVATLFVLVGSARLAHADELWVAPTNQQDSGGLSIGSNAIWPVTPVGAVRLAWGVPNNLQAFQNAKLVLIPHSPGGAATLTVYVCTAQNATLVGASCAGPFAHAFTGVANQLQEVDVSSELAPRIGVPGQNYIGLAAYTTPTTNTDHIVGLRFAYGPTAPSGVASLGANTFTGTLTAPAFVGDGSGVSNVNANLLDGLDSTAFATLGLNTFAATQTINAGNLDLDVSTATTGNLTKDGAPFLHNFGGISATFLGENAGNFTTTTFGLNTGLGAHALSNLTTGTSNTAVGARALFANTSGFQNTATGRFALADNTTGADNTGIGDVALQRNTTGRQHRHRFPRARPEHHWWRQYCRRPIRAPEQHLGRCQRRRGQRRGQQFDERFLQRLSRGGRAGGLRRRVGHDPARQRRLGDEGVYRGDQRRRRHRRRNGDHRRRRPARQRADRPWTGRQHVHRNADD